MKCASGSRKARSESVSIDCEHGSDIESMTGFGTGRVEADGMIVVAASALTPPTATNHDLLPAVRSNGPYGVGGAVGDAPSVVLPARHRNDAGPSRSGHGRWTHSVPRNLRIGDRAGVRRREVFDNQVVSTRPLHIHDCVRRDAHVVGLVPRVLSQLDLVLCPRWEAPKCHNGNPQNRQ